jgi:Cof subfamily protein (haloacid dehalogenase superfamily)
VTSIRLIAIDLDGTLLVDSRDVSPENVAAVTEAISRGVIVAIATGRPHFGAAHLVGPLGLGDVPIISYNGAIIRRPDDPEPMAQWPLDADVAQDIVRYCVERRLHTHYYLDDVMYVTRFSHWAQLYNERTGIVGVPVGDMRRFDGQSPTKILVCIAPDELPEVLEDARQVFDGRAYVTRSMPEYMEFLNPQASKGNALRWLADHFSIPMSETMGIGDMLNDLPLVAESGFGVAMVHAQDEVKAAAQFVTTQDDTGVAEAINKFVLGTA